MVCGFFREFRPFIGAKLAKKKQRKKNKFFVEEITLASGEGFFVRFFFRCTRNLRCRFDDFHRSWYCFLFFGEGVGLIKMAVSMQSSSNFGRYISLFFYRVPTRMDHSRVLSLLTSIPFFFGFFGFFFSRWFLPSLREGSRGSLTWLATKNVFQDSVFFFNVNFFVRSDFLFRSSRSGPLIFLFLFFFFPPIFLFLIREEGGGGVVDLRTTGESLGFSLVSFRFDFDFSNRIRFTQFRVGLIFFYF